MTASASSRPLSLADLLAIAETEADRAGHSLAMLDAVLDAVSGSLTPEADAWRLSECDFGRVLRGFERVRERRQRLSTRLATQSPDEPDVNLAVEELATAVGFDAKKTYRWLKDGRFPGVLQPGGPGTEYYIPADTPERFRNQASNREEK